MGVYVEGQVSCDEPLCLEQFRQGYVGGGMNRTWIIWLARKEGWAISGSGAQTVAKCPKHRRGAK